jgi:hypothetical protein
MGKTDDSRDTKPGPQEYEAGVWPPEAYHYVTCHWGKEANQTDFRILQESVPKFVLRDAESITDLGVNSLQTRIIICKLINSLKPKLV